MATYPVYPESLPCVSRIDGYGMTAAAGVLKTPLEFANARQRRMHARMPQEIALSWRCTNAEMHAVVAWLNEYGYDWFKLYLAGVEASQDEVFAKQIIVRLMSNISTTLMPVYRQNWWKVSCSAEYQPPPSTLLVDEGEEPTGPEPFVYDTFTGTNGTEIIDHTGESGVTWTEGAGERHMIAAGHLMGIIRPGSDTRMIPSDGVSGEWYFEISITVNELNTTDYIQAYQHSDDAFLFFLDATGLYTEVESLGSPFTAGNTYVVRFTFTAGQVEVFIDGVSQYVDTDIPILPTGVISFDVFNSFPAAVGDPTIASPDEDQQYDPDWSFHINYVLMAPLDYELEESFMMAPSTALFVPLTTYTPPEPEPSAYSTGFDEGFA
jgi:hypothetical protein